MKSSDVGGFAASRAWLERVAGSAWFAYGSILLIQAKVLWGIWDHRDLSAGDTSNYVVFAADWANRLELAPLYSPLYTAVWGTLAAFIHDVYAVTIAHRMIIVIAVTLLALAVLRRLLTPVIAWLLAAWWAVMPVNYDTLNELHLFSLLPVLAAALVALRYSGSGMRAGVFGILLGAAVLQRNEFMIAAAAWLALCVVWEWRDRSRTEQADSARRGRRTIRAFGLATFAVAALALLVISRSPHERSAGGWWDEASDKQAFALCQHYAVGYQQRHDRDPVIGWTDCESLMRRDFGSDMPSFAEALAEDPHAMAQHFAWNLRLSGYGLQVALLNRTSGPVDENPDYLPVKTGSILALIGSLLLIGIVSLGVTLLWRARREWWEGWLRDRFWGWAVLGAGAAMGIWVAITTHPRPSYFFPLTFALIAATGLCLMAIVRRWPAIRAFRATLPLVAIVGMVTIPQHYTSSYSSPLIGSGRPVKEMVQRLEPFREELDDEDVHLLASHSEGCSYIGGDDPCRPVSLAELINRPATLSAPEWLSRERIDFIYADATNLGDPAVETVMRGLVGRGWRPVAPATGEGEDWLFLARVTGTPQ